MKPDDRNKLNECISILQDTDLGLSLVWLWTWDSILYKLQDDDNYRSTVTEEEIWEHLCEAVEAGRGFSLEWGPEQHSEELTEWMLDNGYIIDILEEEEEEEEDEDE
jgi:hypothetical protein